jgi:NAD(P)-dependent dehydrogenase (short-subunit alcohol dehydrogenase family)
VTHDQFGLENTTAFVSGGAGHLGRAMVSVLAEAGAHVIVNGRGREKLELLVGELRAAGLSAEAMPFDVTDAAARDRAFADISTRLGTLNVLINNAHAGRPGTVDSATDEDFTTAHSVHVTAAFGLVKAARPLLAAAAAAGGPASVINVASMYGVVSPDPSVYGTSGFNSAPYYGAAKGGLLQLTRYLAVHLARENIRVNALSPGPFPPSSIEVQHPQFASALKARVPMGRLGRPEDIQGVVLFLASAASSYITGINVPVDGGWTAW